VVEDYVHVHLQWFHVQVYLEAIWKFDCSHISDGVD